ncbi:hypothetical protein O6H91_04G081200 [Diphasiastrum complanatum]|uniref:Uncharacterized protein n=1 Tax=Diphasiastrum complanatum TaxID=34168 RepID=A0ACC2DZ33_DIPCM|nr:hypothetical protein O6H91_04G081200 [Diphasiastrum complanatum]
MREGEERAREWQQDGATTKSEERGTSPGFWFVVLLAAAAAHNTANRRGSFQGTNYYGWWSFKVGKPDFNEGSWYGERSRGGRRLKEPPFFWDEVFEELERKERIRRMQDAFNRERASNTRGYEKWQEHPWSRDQFSEEDQYWDGANRNKQKADYEQHYKSDLYRRAGLRQHYAVLGLDPLRPQQYTEAEIKAAFRQKAMEYHPDRNQENKDYSEVKFRQIKDSYEVIKQQHKFS